jgi:hypothetical protein
MWDADKIYYRGETDYDRAFIGSDLVWYPINKFGDCICITSSADYEDDNRAIFDDYKLKKGENVIKPMSNSFNFENKTVTKVDFLNYKPNSSVYFQFYNSNLIEFNSGEYCLEYVNSNQEGLDYCERLFEGAHNLETVKLKRFPPDCVSFNYMFTGCEKLKNVTIDNTWTQNLQSTSSMFWLCSSLEEAPYFDMSVVQNADYMFEGCSSLKKVPKYNVESLNSSTMFYGANRLEELEGLIGLRCSMDFSSSDYITRESVLNIVREAYIPFTPQTLKFSQAVLDRLTNEDITMAIEKGWIISA